MGQVTKATIKMIYEYGSRGEHAPLTVWEEQQLARMAERHIWLLEKIQEHGFCAGTLAASIDEKIAKGN
jgi:hypothetical protein